MDIKTPDAPTILNLVRHGQSEWNGKNRITGQCDPPLTDKGIRQSRSLARVLAKRQLSAIYTSTLRRAIDTSRATAISQQLRIQLRGDLKEINLGILQGRYRDLEARQLWDAWHEDRLNFRVPGAESFMDLTRRVIPCVNGVLAEINGGEILIVGHRNTNRVILGTLMQWPVEQLGKLNLRSKYLYRVALGEKPEITTTCLMGPNCNRTYAEFRM